jgi:hypothetical protein
MRLAGTGIAHAAERSRIFAGFIRRIRREWA